MATSSFYNDNLYRTYPFVADNHSIIPNEWLSGIKVRMNYGAGFTLFPSVFLTEWQTEDEHHVLTFSCESAGRIISKTVSILAGTPTFARVVSDADQRIQITLIVGNLPTERISQTGMRLRIEPTCILWLIHRGITSVEVGNRARRVLPLPDRVEHEFYGKAEGGSRWNPMGSKPL